jgi:hypothetical protein
MPPPRGQRVVERIGHLANATARASYSITSSARSMIDGGMARPVFKTA